MSMARKKKGGAIADSRARTAEEDQGFRNREKAGAKVACEEERIARSTVLGILAPDAEPAGTRDRGQA